MPWAAHHTLFYMDPVWFSVTEAGATPARMQSSFRLARSPDRLILYRYEMRFTSLWAAACSEWFCFGRVQFLKGRATREEAGRCRRLYGRGVLHFRLSRRRASESNSKKGQFRNAGLIRVNVLGKSAKHEIFSQGCFLNLFCRA